MLKEKKTKWLQIRENLNCALGVNNDTDLTDLLCTHSGFDRIFGLEYHAHKQGAVIQ